MTLRHWAIFAAWQITGALTGLAAHHLDTLSWMVSALMLMPGTLLSLYVFREGGIGNELGKWALFGVAASVNTLMFGLVAIIRRKRT